MNMICFPPPPHVLRSSDLPWLGSGVGWVNLSTPAASDQLLRKREYFLIELTLCVVSVTQRQLHFHLSLGTSKTETHLPALQHGF